MKKTCLREHYFPLVWTASNAQYLTIALCFRPVRGKYSFKRERANFWLLWTILIKACKKKHHTDFVTFYLKLTLYMAFTFYLNIPRLSCFRFFFILTSILSTLLKIYIQMFWVRFPIWQILCKLVNLEKCQTDPWWPPQPHGRIHNPFPPQWHEVWQWRGGAPHRLCLWEVHFGELQTNNNIRSWVFFISFR